MHEKLRFSELTFYGKNHQGEKLSLAGWCGWGVFRGMFWERLFYKNKGTRAGVSSCVPEFFGI